MPAGAGPIRGAGGWAGDGALSGADAGGRAGAGGGDGVFAGVVAGWGAGGPDDAARGMMSTSPAAIVSGSAPIAARLAAYSAGQPPGTPSAAAIPDRVSPAATAYQAGAPRPGRARTVPGRMRPGSGPTARRLAAYSAGQPPGTPSAAAMPDRVSPGCTT